MEDGVVDGEVHAGRNTVVRKKSSVKSSNTREMPGAPDSFSLNTISPRKVVVFEPFLQNTVSPATL